ncbi:hypothetical protein PoB_001885200 [Plakobranchus ocellatus]|uniref:Uncharacterized protein n=1 Tax=Plakobranchus ocellatus TaxID=259542 RepID=A0AAV3ZCW4_9GAST|nr:hypothetical protein PoB_001885200 [Plakobranchus ocellatus]
MSFSSNDMVRLRNDLLTNYSVGVLPLRNQSVSLPVNMSFFLIMIHNLCSTGIYGMPRGEKSTHSSFALLACTPTSRVCLVSYGNAPEQA